MISRYPFTKEVNPERLTSEIISSSILTAFDHIEFTYPNNLAVFFKAELSSVDQTTLANLVSAHVNIPLTPEEDLLKATDKRLIVKPSVRPLLTYGCCVSMGDNPNVPGDVGGGADLAIVDHKIGDPQTTEVVHFFNCEKNRSYVFDGFLFFENARFDELTYIIKPAVTPTTPGTGTNFKAYSGIIVPAAGNGDLNVDVATIKPVSSVPKTDTGVYPSAWWNADYSSSTGQYSNLTAALDGKGKYNLFYTDYIIKRYINRFVMLGSGSMTFAATDPSELGTNLQCVYVFTTANPDHEWRASMSVTMFREKIK